MAKQSRISEIIVHYSATYEDDDSVTPEIIDRWHRARGFAGIGYHFVIDRKGAVHRGRPLHIVGAHAPPNTGRAGICTIGGLRRQTGANVGVDTRTPAQTAALTALIAELRAGVHNSSLVTVDPDAAVLGHRDVGRTQCPGFDVPKWWAEVTGTPPPERPSAAPAKRPPVRTEGVAEDPEPAKERVVTPADAVIGGGVLAALGAALATGTRFMFFAAALAGAAYLAMKLIRARRA